MHKCIPYCRERIYPFRDLHQHMYMIWHDDPIHNFNIVVVRFNIQQTCFRKWYATGIYKANGCDIALVQRLLQHSSASTTQRYIGIEPERIEQAIQNHVQLI